MIKLIGVSGAHGCGKTSVLDELKRQQHPEIFIDDFKVSRTVLAELGMTLEEVTASAELTKAYQKKVLDRKIQRDGSELPGAAYGAQVKSIFVDRTVADIYAYTRLWCEKNNIEQEWFNSFEQICIGTIRLYDKVLLIPIGKFAFVDDGIRAKEETQATIASYIEEFVVAQAKKYHVIESTSVDLRAHEILRIIKNK
jgi:hypothetical protein